MLMTVCVSGFIENSDHDYELRVWTLEKFGSPFAAGWTLFEATFTGSWVKDSQRLIHEVSYAWVFFWIFYVVTVNFAITRVIAAMFLKQTMAIAAADADQVAMDAMKQKTQFAEKLKNIFKTADTTGDGMINAEEFLEMISNPEVMESFHKMELELEEVGVLFKIIAGDDGEADYEEFLAGALKMKSSVRSIDTIQLIHSQGKTTKMLADMQEQIGQLHAHHSALASRAQ